MSFAQEHHADISQPAHHSGMLAPGRGLPLAKALDANVTKLHIPHSVQSSPSLLGNKQFLEVSRLKALSGLKDMKFDNIKPHVGPFVFPVRHGVSVLSPGRLLNFGCAAGHHSFDVVFLHDTGSGAVWLRYWQETTAYKNEVYLD